MVEGTRAWQGFFFKFLTVAATYIVTSFLSCDELSKPDSNRNPPHTGGYFHCSMYLSCSSFFLTVHLHLVVRHGSKRNYHEKPGKDQKQKPQQRRVHKRIFGKQAAAIFLSMVSF